MAFDFAEWKKQAAERLRGFKREAGRYGPGALYAGLCATALWPVAQAMGSQGMLAGLQAFGGIAASAGASLVAAKVWDVKGKAEDAARREIETWVADQTPTNVDVRAAFDEILTKLEAPREAQTSLSEADKKWFVDALLNDVKALGSALNVTINTGGGAYVAGEVSVNGDFVGRDKIIHTLIESLTIVTGKADPSEESGWLASYLRAVIEDCSGINLQAIDDSAARGDRDSARREPPKLSDVYVDLNTTLRVPSKFASLAELYKNARFLAGARNEIYGLEVDAQLRKDKSRTVSVLEAFAHHREMVLLGKPGSGKSTFSSFVSLNLARAASGHASSLTALGERWTYGALLPVRVTLRKFAQFLSTSDSEGNAGDLRRFIRAEIEKDLGPHEADLIDRLVKHTGALLIFDGLDEASTPDLRKRVLAAVQDFKRKAHERSRFLITARPYAWGTPDPAQGEYEVADFDAEQIKTFVERWYDALVNWGWLRQDEADHKRDHLLPACERPDLRPLAENPLLLTLMATLNANRVELPDDRADLYNAVVELLMERWNQRLGKEQSLIEQFAVPRPTIANLREIVEKVAFDAHMGHEGKDGAADIEVGTLIHAFAPLLDSLAKAQLVVNYVDERAGLLIGLGERKHDGSGASSYSFPHRTFQEFLAGCHLARLNDFKEQVCALADRNAGHWRLALTFAARMAQTQRGVSAADALVHYDENPVEPGPYPVSNGDARRAMIAADQLLELGLPAVNSIEHGRKVRRRVATWLAGAMRGTLRATERAEAGRLVANLGDPRRGVLSVDDMPMCYVPPGEFIMGGDRYDSEKPEHDQQVKDGFWISQFPVTNAHFDQFVRGQGYVQKEFWTEAIAAKRWENGLFRDGNDAWRGASRPFTAPYALANHPAVGVTWYEALAFARWLGKRLQRECGLPNEAQWEYAARGPRYAPKVISPLVRTAKALGEATPRTLQDFANEIGHARPSAENRRTYPWGEGADPDKMNFNETGIGSTSAVGAFPSGISLFGCEDMSGNVWEWTMTKRTGDYKDYDRMVDNRPDGSEARRILRGGAFSRSGNRPRCAARYDDFPSYDYGRSLGFRVVASPIRP